MLNSTTPVPTITQSPASGAVRRIAFPFGFWAAVLTALTAVVTFAVAVNTLPMSGPFCAANCVVYPYADVAYLVPHDYLWLYPATLLAVLFLVLMACVDHYIAVRQSLYSRIGLCFAVIAAAVLSIDYYIQLATMQPSLLQGEQEGMALISQYNPHGIFIALEELGYLMMSVAFLFMGLALAGPSKLERAARWLLGIGAVLGLGAYVVMSILFGKALEYRFEVAIISINYMVLIAGGVLLALLFRRAGGRSAQ